MFIAFIPFSTALLGEYRDQQIAVVVYGINIAIAAFWAYIQWWHAAKDRRLLDAGLDPTFITIISRRSLVGPILYLIGVALSFVSIEASLITYIAIPLYYLVPARRNKSWLWFTRNK
jgi:uncharacterized membrane protein